MKQGLNRHELIGNVGTDPELFEFDSGTTKLTFSLATNDTYYDQKKKEEVQQTEWHNIVVWGKRAEALEKHIKKGQLLFVEGKSKTRKYEDKDGNDRYVVEVEVRDIKFLGGKDRNVDRDYEDEEDDDRPRSRKKPSPRSSKGGSSRNGTPRGKRRAAQEEEPDDDLPF